MKTQRLTLVLCALLTACADDPDKTIDEPAPARYVSAHLLVQKATLTGAETIELESATIPARTLGEEQLPISPFEVSRFYSSDLSLPVSTTVSFRLFDGHGFPVKTGSGAIVWMDGHTICADKTGEYTVAIPVTDATPDCTDDLYAKMEAPIFDTVAFSTLDEHAGALDPLTVDQILASPEDFPIITVDLECFAGGEQNLHGQDCIERARTVCAPEDVKCLAYLGASTIFQSDAILATRPFQTQIAALVEQSDCYLKDIGGNRITTWFDPPMWGTWSMDFDCLRSIMDAYIDLLRPFIEEGLIGGIEIDDGDVFVQWWDNDLLVPMDVDRDGEPDPSETYQDLAQQQAVGELYRYLRNRYKTEFGKDFIFSTRAVSAFWGVERPTVDMASFEHPMFFASIDIYACGDRTIDCTILMGQDMAATYSMLFVNHADPDQSERGRETVIALSDVLGDNTLATHDRNGSDHGGLGPTDDTGKSEYDFPERGGACERTSAYPLVVDYSFSTSSEAQTLEVPMDPGEWLFAVHYSKGYDPESTAATKTTANPKHMVWNYGPYNYFSENGTNLKLFHRGPGETAYTFRLFDTRNARDYWAADCPGRYAVVNRHVDRSIEVTFNGTTKIIGPYEGAVWAK